LTGDFNGAVALLKNPISYVSACEAHIMCFDSENMSSDLGGKNTGKYLKDTECSLGLPSTRQTLTY